MAAYVCVRSATQAGAAGGNLEPARARGAESLLSESGRNVSPAPRARSPLTFTFQCGATDSSSAGRVRHSPGARGPQRRRRADVIRALVDAPCPRFSRACDCARITVLCDSDPSAPRIAILECSFRRAKAETGSPISEVV